MAISPALKQLMAQKANKFKSSGDRAAKLGDGRNVVRIVAPTPSQASWVKDPTDYFRELGVHWIKPAENAKPIAVVGCSEICYGQLSLISAAVDMAIANAYDEDSKELYESWKARPSVLVNMIDRSDGAVKLYEVPKGVWGKILELWNLYAEQDADIFDPIHGVDLVIMRNGKGLNTKYDVAVMPLAPGKSFQPVTDADIAKAVDPDEYIQSNFFRGDEQKALNAIAQIAGVVVPSLGAPVTPTPALTSQGAAVAGATIVEAPAPAPAPAASPQTLDPAILAAIKAQLATQQQQAAPAAQPEITPPAQPEPAAPVTAATTLDSLSAEQQDELFRQLSAIG